MEWAPNMEWSCISACKWRSHQGMVANERALEKTIQDMKMKVVCFDNAVREKICFW
jgi:hypothetical protein